MIVELSLGISFLVITVAFLFEYMDATLGMGYGTTLTPVLLIAGFSPLQIIPLVLLSQLICGLLAAFFHHREGNVNFKPKTTKIPIIAEKLKSLGYIESFKRGVPIHLKVALLLAFCGIIGTIAAVFVAVNIPTLWLQLYIGILVFLMGVSIALTINKKFQFSWKKIGLFGLIASFNKGMSGGGYGPVVTGGQLLSGVEGKSAIGITSLSEGLTCAVGVIAYFVMLKSSCDWKLAPYIIIGAALSVPFSAKTVKKINTKALKFIIAIFTIILGLATILKTLRGI